VHYLQHAFEVPEGTKRLKVTLTYRKEQLCQLFLSVFGPDGYRGTRMKPGVVGEVVLELDLSASYASEGGLPGPLRAGTWRAQIDIERTEETVDYTLTVDAYDAAPVETPQPQPAPQNGRAGAGYYRGELHAHSHHSDGSASVAALVAAARRYGLNFLSLTDHFTSAGWAELESLAGPDLAVIRGLELTGHSGHANLQGLSTWVDPFVDPCNSSGHTVNDVARDVRAQGGLFCVNHPFSLTLGWRYHEFDWSQCDLLEVYHHLTGSNNSAQLGLWDSLLARGYRVTGVGATDSHNPHAGTHRLGQVLTYVYAPELSPPAIIAGLRSGRAYVSLGPQLEFTAEAGTALAHMGETLPAGDPVTLHLQLSGLDFPSRLLVLKNGLHHAYADLPAGEGPLELSFQDDAPVPGYYRLELYARALHPSFEAGREWDKTLLLSNPIYVGG
jgi:hypothetical protein